MGFGLAGTVFGWFSAIFLRLGASADYPDVKLQIYFTMVWGQLGGIQIFHLAKFSYKTARKLIKWLKSSLRWAKILNSNPNFL